VLYIVLSLGKSILQILYFIQLERTKLNLIKTYQTLQNLTFWVKCFRAVYNCTELNGRLLCE